MQFPADDRYLMTRRALIDKLKGLLAGRAAEELVFDELSTGASDDLSRATQIARSMVCRFGMSETLGPATFGRESQQVFLGRDFTQEERNYSESTAVEIDRESVILRGRAASYHVKQLAQQGAREALPNATLENAIVVE
jgi:cell division protease FtsH